MRRVLALAAVAVAATATPSGAAVCFGSDATARACVNRDVTVTPTGGPVAFSDCVVVGDPNTCYPVGFSSPNVTVTGSGSVTTVTCAVCEEVPTVPPECNSAAGDWFRAIAQDPTPPYPAPTFVTRDCI